MLIFMTKSLVSKISLDLVTSGQNENKSELFESVHFYSTYGEKPFILAGTCFVDFSEEITVVYGKYCRNHDEAIAFLEKVRTKYKH